MFQRYHHKTTVEDGTDNWETNSEIRLDPKYWRQSLGDDENIVLLEAAELVLVNGQASGYGLAPPGCSTGV